MGLHCVIVGVCPRLCICRACVCACTLANVAFKDPVRDTVRMLSFSVGDI